MVLKSVTKTDLDPPYGNKCYTFTSCKKGVRFFTFGLTTPLPPISRKFNFQKYNLRMQGFKISKLGTQVQLRH